MELRTLGTSGLKVSLVGLGCNNFGGRTDQETSRMVVHRALDLGINFLDTADIYANRGGSEQVLGEILGERRKEVILATKFGGPMDDAGRWQGASRRYIMLAVEASLRRLKTDWIDLYQLHFADPSTPMEETLGALDDLIRQGKIRYIGSSNLAAWQIVEAAWIARSKGLNGFISSQNEYSLLARKLEAETLPVLGAYGLGLLPYFPLASGLLTGKYKRGAAAPADTRFAKTKALADMFLTEANLDAAEKLQAFASARDHSMVELAFAWLTAQPKVASIIAGASTPAQVEENVKAAGNWLTPADLAEIDALQLGTYTK